MTVNQRTPLDKELIEHFGVKQTMYKMTQPLIPAQTWVSYPYNVYELGVGLTWINLGP